MFWCTGLKVVLSIWNRCACACMVLYTILYTMLYNEQLDQVCVKTIHGYGCSIVFHTRYGFEIEVIPYIPKDSPYIGMVSSSSEY